MFTFKPLIFIKHRPTSRVSPKPRSGHRIVCNDMFMYSFGGFNPTIPDDDPQMSRSLMWSFHKPLFKEGWRFNTTTNEWSLMMNQHRLPNELASMAVILTGTLLFMHGGTGCPFGERNSNRTYIFNIVNDNIIPLPTKGDVPEPQYGQAIFRHENYLYSIGGTNGYDYTCDIHRLDLTKHQWESVYICSGKEPCEPTGRYRHEVAFDGRRIFVLGGGTADFAFPLFELPTFDLVTNKWSTLMTNSNGGFPKPRRCHGVVQYKDEISGNMYAVISGGFNQVEVLNDVWKLNLQTLQWTCLPQTLPFPVYFHSTAITPSGRMFTFGGIKKFLRSTDEETNERTNAVHSIWLVIPRLTEICWLALNHYCPQLKFLSNAELFRLGIPIKYIRRLKGILDDS